MTKLRSRPAAPLFVLSLALFGCKGESADESAAPAQAAVVAETAVITPQPFAESVEGIGTVVPRIGGFAAIGVPIAARIARVLVSVGQQVKAGEALIELDRTSIDAEAASAEAALVAADAAAARANRLLAAGVLPRKDAEAATADAAKARAALATARHTATLATMRSTLDGVVTRVNATVGVLADPGLPLVEVANPASLDLLIAATTIDAGKLRPGMRVTLRDGADSVGEGVVADVGAAVDSVTRSVAVRIHVGPTARRLRLGETVSGRVALPSDPKAITVPITALVPAGEGFQVFVVDSAGIAHARPVTVAGKDEVRAHLTAGVAAGERIVTAGAYGMDEGAKVVPAGARP
ncbi:MAG: efflux RND transporter periplasmic adaptor subunit [Gemmatimonadales bacterium]